jgi:pimeloyl-ACP methyl ester carboxylesterase
LNVLPQFVTEIDGLDIHFIHVRSKHENALPLIVTHGWPGSVIEQLKIIDPLTNPTAHGASASDAFHVVIPSLPGYGFSAHGLICEATSIRPNDGYSSANSLWIG